MQTLKCIKARRSKRLFLDKEVSDGLVGQILEAAVCAPSSEDCQPWHFVIVKDQAIKKQLASLKDEDNQQHILTSSICIVVCVDTEKSPSRWAEDGILATENILLAAHDLGLGAVYISGFKPGKPERVEKVKEFLNLPENITPITILPIGYPDSKEKLEDKTLLDVSGIIHKDRC